MLKLLLWFRYFRRRKVVLLSVAALAISVALLVVVSSLFSGFIEALERSAVEVIGDVQISCRVGFSHHDELVAALEASEQVEAATAVMLTQGLLHLGQGNVRAVQVFGVEPKRFRRVVHFRDSLATAGGVSLASAASAPMRGFIGIGVVSEPNELTDQYDDTLAREMLGRRMVLTTGSIRNEAEGSESGSKGQPTRKSVVFTVADVFRSGNYFFDGESIFLPLDRLYGKLDASSDESYVQRVQIKLADGAETGPALAEIEAIWRRFGARIGLRRYDVDSTEIMTSIQMQASYIGEIRKQMGMLMVIFGIVDVGVIALIFCIFYMIVRLKQRDIGIIRSCGGSATAVAIVFLAFGAFVGLVGALVGVLLGFWFTANINVIEAWVARSFGLNLWNSSLYVFEHIPNQVDWEAALLICLSAIAAASAGVLIPALLAARTRPVEILRYE